MSHFDILLASLPFSSISSTALSSSRAGIELHEKAALRLLIVSIQLEELSHRSHQAFRLMQLHLRTPPAPTFAPLVITILSICAEVNSLCQKMLWEDQDERKSLSAIYSVVRNQGDGKDTSSFRLDAKSKSHKAMWTRMLRRVDQKEHKNLDWLPGKLTRPNVATKLIASEMLQSDINSMISVLDHASEEEDLGEAL